MEPPSTQLPVLLYHKVDNRNEFGFTISSPSAFHRQMKMVAGHGIRLVPMEDMMTNPDPASRGLTFDDGYESIHRLAFPILRELGFAGTVFLLTDFIGRDNRWESPLSRGFKHLNDNQIFALQFEGWRMGSHGKSHTAFTFLSDAVARIELTESKEILEQRFGQPIESFAFPFGRYRERHLAMALETGYRWLCVNQIDSSLPDEFKSHLVERRSIYRWEPASSFEHKLLALQLLPKYRKRLRLASWLANGAILHQRIRHIFI